MRKLVLVCGILFAFSSVAKAQTPRWEIYGGGDYLSTNACPLAQALTGNPNTCSVLLFNGTSTSFSQKGYGWHASIEENKSSWFGGVLDFSGDYASRTVNLGVPSAALNVRFNAAAYPFLFGPRFYFRKINRLAVFGQPLIGGVHIRAAGPVKFSSPFVTLPWSETKWAFALGGGADYRLTRMVAIRGQADWIRSHFPETLAQNFQNSIRLSAGLVLTIGHE